MIYGIAHCRGEFGKHECLVYGLDLSTKQSAMHDGVGRIGSDHALASHCLRLTGVSDTVPNAGRLFGCGKG